MNREEPVFHSLACPKCGAPQKVVPVTVLRPADKALGLLFKGTLNRFPCADCGAAIRVDVPLIYRDDARPLVIYFLPPGESGPVPPKQAEEQVDAVLTAVFGAKAEGARPECRLALAKAEFIEKIAIFRANLDDRLVEFIKYQLHSRRPAELDPARRELLYDFSKESKDRLGFIIFNRELGQAETAIDVPMDVYRELATAFLSSADLQDELRKLFPGYIVSAASLF